MGGQNSNGGGEGKSTEAKAAHMLREVLAKANADTRSQREPGTTPVEESTPDAARRDSTQQEAADLANLANFVKHQYEEQKESQQERTHHPAPCTKVVVEPDRSGGTTIRKPRPSCCPEEPDPR